MKPKWAFPFIPMYVLAYKPPADMVARTVLVVGVLALVITLLGIIQPWKRDRGVAL